MPRALTSTALAALIALTLTLALPGYALAQEGQPLKSTPIATANDSSPFSTTEQADGTILDELVLAVVATLAGSAFVYFVFVRNRDESRG